MGALDDPIPTWMVVGFGEALGPAAPDSPWPWIGRKWPNATESPEQQ